MTRTLVPVASATLLLLAASACPGILQKSTDVERPLRIAEAIDQVVQARFQDDAGAFGITRLIGPDGHYRVLGGGSRGEEDPLIQKANPLKLPYHVRFLRMAHKPGKYLIAAKNANTPEFLASRHSGLISIGTSRDGRWSAGSYPPELATESKQKALLNLAQSFVPRLARGLGATSEFENWLVMMSPVRATKASCVGCHPGAKRGDTLGAMMYFVRSKPEALPELNAKERL